MISIKSFLTASVFYTAAAVAAGRVASSSEKMPAIQTEPIVYPIPSGLTQATAFNVSVRSMTGNGTWHSVGTYLINLNRVNTTTGAADIQKSSMAYFDFGDPVEISVTYNNGPVSHTAIRPVSYNIKPTLQGNTTIFSLYKPSNIIVQVNDNIFDCLHLFTNKLENNIPSANDTDVIYFGPGLHSVSGGELVVPSNKTVYVAGGGALTFKLLFLNVSNAGVRGRGIVHGSTIVQSSDIFVDGVIAITAGNLLVGESNGIKIHNFRSFSSAGWGDGMDFFCSQNVVISNVFMRNSDDCIAIYQHRNNSGWDFFGDSKNITIKDSSLWADVAHPINMGTHGNPLAPETMSGVTISNIDILDHREMQMDYQGCIAINPGDENLIKDIYITDVRVENFRIGQVVNMRVIYNTKYNTAPGRGINNVTINNLSYNGNHSNPWIFVGYDEKRVISNITFKNLNVNGNLISDTMKKPAWYRSSDFIPMFCNEHVLNLTFIN
jgi:hypothetical protein